MIVYLCEKPSQGRDIARVLGATSRREGFLEGPGVQVTWCIGHLLEMIAPDGYSHAWKPWRLDTLPMVPEQWQLAVTKRGSKQFKVITQLLKNAHEVVLATDADREGETIGREVLERAGYRGKISRLWLSALDDASIRKALGSLLPGQKTEPLYQAGLGRSRADWLVGMNLSRAYTIMGRQGGYEGVLSVGRVQTPTLKLVVDRDRLIEHFKPVDYFDVSATMQVENGPFQAQWIPAKPVSDEEGRCLDRRLAEQVIQKVLGQTGKVEKAETKRMSEPPPLPLELSTLQQEASRRWAMSAKKTLEVAQALYERHKVVTYPRTDCRFLPNNQFQDAPKILQALAAADPDLALLIQGADTSIRSKAWNDKKITAHHGIIPTAAKASVGTMSRDEFNLYDLIRRHYLVQFYRPFDYDRTVIDVLVASERFRASGRVVKVQGWKEVLGGKPHKKDEKGTGEEHDLPRVEKGEPAQVIQAMLEEKRTKPPSRYTEGTLIQAMKGVGKWVDDPRLRKILRETSGIGTEATRAAIIETLLKRHLLVKEGKNTLISQPVGRVLVDALPHSVTDPATTAVWEQTLDDIAHAGGSLDAFMGKATLWLHKLVGNVRKRQAMGINPFVGMVAAVPPPPQRRRHPAAMSSDTQTACPRCGSPMQRRQSPRGWFLGCSTYPACRETLPDQQGPPTRGREPTVRT